MLLVTSAFGHMGKRVIPSMTNQLEGALGVSIGRERDVRVFRFITRWFPTDA